MESLRHNILRRLEHLRRALRGVVGVVELRRAKAEQQIARGVVNQLREDVRRPLATLVAQMSGDALLPLIVGATISAKKLAQVSVSFRLLVHKFRVRLDVAHTACAVGVGQLHLLDEARGVPQELFAHRALRVAELIDRALESLQVQLGHQVSVHRGATARQPRLHTRRQVVVVHAK